MEIKEYGLLLAKAETTYGTDPTPTTSVNAIPVLNDSLTWMITNSPHERRIMDGQGGKLASIKALPNVELKFNYEVRGNGDLRSGVIADAIEIDCFLLAANLVATYTPESGLDAADGYVTYKPSIPTVVGPSVTCYWYTQNALHKLIGGKVSWKLVAEAGKVPRIEFTVKGKYVEPSDTTFPASATFENTIFPPLFASSTTTLAGFTGLVISKFEFDSGNNIVMRLGATATDGIEGFAITSVEPKLKLDPESIGEAPWVDWDDSVIRAFSSVIGTDGGNRLRLIANCEHKTVTYGEREKIRTQELDLDCVKSTMGANINTIFSLKFY